MFDRIQRLYYSLKYNISYFFHWLVKSFQYSIFLWGDRDWDYSFIYAILRFKLKRVRDCIKSNDIIVGANRVAKEIDVAIKLIDKIQEGPYSYLKKERKALEKKWGPTGFKNEDNSWGPLRKFNKKQEKQYYKEWSTFYRKQDKLYEADIAKLFAHLRDNINKWWD